MERRASNICTTAVVDFSEVHSPTDSSEDSVEVKVEAISIRNKRKCAEPRRCQDGPLKKRVCLQTQALPFRPWSGHVDEKRPEEPTAEGQQIPPNLLPTFPEVPPGNSATVHRTVPMVKVPDVPHAYFRPPSPIKRSVSPADRSPSPPSEPIALVKREPPSQETFSLDIQVKNNFSGGTLISQPQEALRVPLHPQVTQLSVSETERALRSSAEAFPR